MLITEEYLLANPNHVFVFGDNLIRKGKGGAAKLRDLPNTYGFITKKYPNNHIDSFYKPDEYQKVFSREKTKLINIIINNPQCLFLISNLGGGLANRFNIRKLIIEPGLKDLSQFKNVKFI